MRIHSNKVLPEVRCTIKKCTYIVKFEPLGLKDGGCEDALEKQGQFILGRLRSHKKHLMCAELDLRVLAIAPEDHDGSIVLCGV